MRIVCWSEKAVTKIVEDIKNVTICLNGETDLLLLLEELSVEQGNLLAVRVGEAPQRRLVRVVQLRQEVTLLKKIKDKSQCAGLYLVSSLSRTLI